MRHTSYKRILKYLLSGGTAAITEYGIFVILTALHVHIFIANTFSFLCALSVSFLLNKLWVFSSNHRTQRQFSLYLGLALINLAISNGIIWLLVHELSLRALVAKLVTMVSIALWNYVLFSRIIFKHAASPEAV